MPIEGGCAYLDSSINVGDRRTAFAFKSCQKDKRISRLIRTRIFEWIRFSKHFCSVDPFPLSHLAQRAEITARQTDIHQPRYPVLHALRDLCHCGWAHWQTHDWLGENSNIGLSSFPFRMAVRGWSELGGVGSERTSQKSFRPGVMVHHKVRLSEPECVVGIVYQQG